MIEDWIPYSRQQVDDADVSAVEAALRSDWLTTGPAVEAFESALETQVGAPVAVVSSGTAALHASYFAAGLGVGNELITSPLTFVATASAALHLGATVTFADVEDQTLNIDPEAVSAACTSSTPVITARLIFLRP